MEDSVSVDMEAFSPSPKEHLIRTRYGSVSVAVYGDQDKPALITYPDLALNYVSCFQGLLFCPEICSLLLPNFCIYHICPPGHELGAVAIDPDDPILSADDLADQIAEVLHFFGLGAVMCLGVTAGAYILTLFAMKYRQCVLGLILVSPLCKAPSWTEWLYSKVMSNLLYFYGMCGVVKEILLKRYFSKEVRGSAHLQESDIVQACQRSLDERQSLNVWRFLEAINGRSDISEGLRKLQCRSLIFVGDMSPFHCEALHVTSKLDRRFSALVEVQACGSMVTEEQPHAMLIPMEYFLMGYGLYRPSKSSVSPRSPLSPSCISPELFSPESMGLKLKPIKTRISVEKGGCHVLVDKETREEINRGKKREEFSWLGAVMCLGVTAGAYILTLFAMKYRQCVLGLILVSPLCKAPSWTEWLYSKVMSNLLYFYGMCGVVKEILLKRYFSKEVRGSAHLQESDIVQACQRSLDERQSLNVWRFLEAINGRSDISEGLRKLECRSLIFVGDMSPFHSEALHMTSKLDRRFSALVEVQACGSMVTEEQPHAMLIPMEYFLMGYGLYRPSKSSVSPRSPLSPSCISPELFSPESMGLKLKPIKTRISVEKGLVL